ncbi:MAG: hypothetical protein ACI8UO_000429 [Verrucomicrobiales bacterium]|jgi:hypothetical protein
MRQNAGMNWKIALSSFFALAVGISSAIDVPASNGSSVPVIGIRNALPGGLELQLKEGDEVRVVPWNSLDIGKIRQQLPAVAAAYEKTLKGETAPVNLGSYAAKPTAPGAAPAMPKVNVQGDPKIVQSKQLRSGENFGGGEVILSVPRGIGKPKAVVVVFWGDPSLGAVYGDPENSNFIDFAQQNSLALLGVSMAHKGGEPTYQEVEKGSGQAILDSLTELAGKLGKPELGTAPLIMLGSPRTSGAFAFNFAQWKPERVLAIITGLGENYVAEPSPEGIKIPTLFFTLPSNFLSVDQEPEFGLEKTWAKFRDRSPPWVYAKFPYDTSGVDDFDFFFAQKFIRVALKRRLSGPEMTEFNPKAGAQMGHRKTLEVVAANVENTVDANYTWLPDLEFAKAWVKYSKGEAEEPAK